jgi:hypothetical protein
MTRNEALASAAGISEEVGKNAREPHAGPAARRPRAVAFVAVFCIVYALLTALPKAWLLVDAEGYRLTAELVAARAVDGLVAVPFGLQVAHAVLGLPVLLAVGIGLLRGRGWAVLLLAAWTIGVLLMTPLVVGWGAALLIKLAAGILMLAPLATSRARAWFDPAN